MLHVAAERNYSELASLLLERGCNPLAHDNVNNTPLHIGAARGCTEAVRVILDGAEKRGVLQKALSSVATHPGATPIVASVFNNEFDTLRVLLAFQDKCPTAPPRAEGPTPLMAAAGRGAVECARMLLERGKSALATEKMVGMNLDGWTPLHHAAPGCRPVRVAVEEA
eukprot:TRINITY_DN1165_c0_g2_i1.p4 TRINITY_DN1165_c0_g2~~TRINITY_DN1165_c0_g2_i1.p4  ORF type:complete len:168 (-),score=51.63 TRINITY_DN1165_c0_g2_i1:67-570(-)